jgi:hypothetical protein
VSTPAALPHVPMTPEALTSFATSLLSGGHVSTPIAQNNAKS